MVRRLLGLAMLSWAGVWAAATPSSRAAAPFTACLQPLGEHDARLLGPIRRGIEQAYGFTVRRLGNQPMPTAAWYPPRRRYRAQRVLDELRSRTVPAEPACDAVIGLTAADISITRGRIRDWGVLGLAYRGDRVAVVSSFRLRRGVDHDRVTERAVKVAIHELGHVVGLPHGNAGPACIMNDAGGAVQTIDRARGSLCASERIAAEALLGRALPRRRALDWKSILRARD